MQKLILSALSLIQLGYAQEMVDETETYWWESVDRSEHTHQLYTMDDEVIVDVDLTIFIEVASNPTTGYVWTYLTDCVESGILRIDDKYFMDEAEEDMVGVGGTHVFALTGRKYGVDCNFSAMMGRPWELESGGLPLEERTINVSVTYNCIKDPTCKDYGIPQLPPEDKEDEDPRDEYGNFKDWLVCYLETYSECGARHSEHYDCYYSNEDCDDPNWHDCFWFGIDCYEEPQDEYERGFESGYMDGYADAARDTMGPEPEEMDTFQLQLVSAGFEDWVQE